MGLSRSEGANINVTPLIDVLLVLLVIFLFAIPQLLRLETVEVPRKADAPTEPALPTLTIRIGADLSISLLDEDDRASEVAAGELPAVLRAHLRDIPHAIFVDFDDAVPWSSVVGTIDTIRGVASGDYVALKMRE